MLDDVVVLNDRTFDLGTLMFSFSVLFLLEPSENPRS